MPAKIALTQNLFALVDDEDKDRVNAYKWHVINKVIPYAVRTEYPKGCKGKGHRQYMHRFILGLQDPADQVDHINGDVLDNRKCNLRACTSHQNAMNRVPKKRNCSGETGVYWHKRAKAWESRIGFGGKILYIGRSKDLDTAVQIRKDAEALYFGEFAPRESRTV